MRLCAVSVDLDEVHHYADLHGVTHVAPKHAVYDVALARMRELAAEVSLPLTLFVVAADVAREENAAGLREMLAGGHEIANHSLDHRYDLTRRSPAEQQQQVAGASTRLRDVLGVQPVGFRAPGYTVTDALLAVVRDCGFHYDSSVFPCPPYYAAKASALGLMKLRGKSSRSVLDTPQVLRAPTSPYRIGRPYWTRGTGLLELPIQVAGPLRLPFIGTSLTVLGARGARWLTRAVLGQPLVNLELHGLDFLDSSDVPGALARVQADLRRPWPRKREALLAVLELLRKHRYAFVSLAEAARAFS